MVTGRDGLIIGIYLARLARLSRQVPAPLKLRHYGALQMYGAPGVYPHPPNFNPNATDMVRVRVRVRISRVKTGWG